MQYKGQLIKQFKLRVTSHLLKELDSPYVFREHGPEDVVAYCKHRPFKFLFAANMEVSFRFEGKLLEQKLRFLWLSNFGYILQRFT